MTRYNFSHLQDVPFGRTLPHFPDRSDDLFAIGASMPTEKDVRAYEEGADWARAKLRQAYPRFVLHHLYEDLCKAAASSLVRDDAFLMLFPSQKVAQRCVHFCGGGQAVAAPLPGGLYAAVVPAAARGKARAFWQHAGQIVSARQASDILKGCVSEEECAVKSALQERIAGFANHETRAAQRVAAADVYLSPSGMGAISGALDVVRFLWPERETVQLTFPYVDTLKYQEKMGIGGHYIAYGPEMFAQLEALVLREFVSYSAVICEVPNNPLLQTVDLAALSDFCRAHDLALIIDDTIGSWANVDVLPYADLIVSSLSKSFSGGGNVMGGSAIVNPNSPHYTVFKQAYEDQHEDLLYGPDAKVLLENSEDFLERAAQMSAHALALVQFFRAQECTAQVYYPEGDPAYEALRKPGGGYGGLFSVVMKDPVDAYRYYDALCVPKGPGLGTNFSLVCLYTLLAHYEELERVASMGVPAHLLRVSAGVNSDLPAFGQAIGQL